MALMSFTSSTALYKSSIPASNHQKSSLLTLKDLRPCVLPINKKNKRNEIKKLPAVRKMKLSCHAVRFCELRNRFDIF